MKPGSSPANSSTRSTIRKSSLSRTRSPWPLLKTGGPIDGELTIRGVHQHVRFELTASACPEAVARTCPTEAAGTIRRSDFGMHSRRGALSDKVQLGFSIFLLPVAEAVQ